MRLYGSVNNRLLEHVTSPPPSVGDGATLLMYTDRYPATVVKVSPSGKTVWVTEDNVTKWEPHPSGYGVEFAPNPNGKVLKVTKRRNGTWKTSPSGEGVRFGSRSAYRDPHF